MSPGAAATFWATARNVQISLVEPGAQFRKNRAAEAENAASQGDARERQIFYRGSVGIS